MCVRVWVASWVVSDAREVWDVLRAVRRVVSSVVIDLVVVVVVGVLGTVWILGLRWFGVLDVELEAEMAVEAGTGRHRGGLTPVEWVARSARRVYAE